MATEHIDLPKTDFKSILVCPHGRQRRLEREIRLAELGSVIGNGKKEKQKKKRWKYTFGGVSLITDRTSSIVITSWVEPGHGLDLKKIHITSEMEIAHEVALVKLEEDKSCWTSHNVIVVDQSGSMRETDATEGVTRSDLVWLTLATVLVAEKIRSGERRPTDVISVVDMRDDATVLIREQPYDWILYNKMVELLRTSLPLHHGNYLPSFQTAKDLLLSNSYSGCALMLIFLSDGKPSDRYTNKSLQGKTCDILKREMGEIASYLANRLTVGTIAIGSPGSSGFVTLKAMVDGAKEYGSHGVFQSASLSADSLATTLTNLTSTVTSTMVQMTEAGGSKQRQFREFRTEPVSNVGKDELTDEFDSVEMSSRQVELANGARRWFRSIIKQQFVPGQGWLTSRRGQMFNSPQADGVAFKKRWFGCGGERLVKEFREVETATGRFVGPMMVAKDTKFVRRGNDRDEKDFHYIFCKTQEKAKKYSASFNRRLLRIGKSIGRDLPTIDFLDCYVYMIEHPIYGRHGYLVERMLDIKQFKYLKWNNNNGGVRGQRAKPDDVRQNLEDVFAAQGGLEAIGEEDEYDSDEDCSDESETSCDISAAWDHCDVNIEDDDIPQAFSCFTYHFTRRKMVVCDLQGTFNTNRCPPVFELTDPAIHHYESGGSKRHYGRSDKGEAGIVAFLKTHKCSNLCRMLKSLIFVRAPAVVLR